jgi:Zn-dependent M28 family amino/carboxypeptidase
MQSRHVLAPQLALLGLLSILAACQRAAEPPPAAKPAVSEDARRAAATVDTRFLSDRIREISDDSFEGRAPATPGDVKARAWLAEQLKTLGFEPGGPDGSWEQSFDIVGVTSKLPAQWTFRAGGKTLALKYGTQYAGSGGTQEKRASIPKAELVFVGYGIQAPEFQWDDYKGADLKGKVLVMLNNDPDWDPALFAGTTRLWYGRWDYKYLSAARQGAAAAIIIHTAPSAGYEWQVVQSSWSGVQFSLPATEGPRVQLRAWVTEDAARALAQLGGKDLAQLVESAKSRDFRPVPLGVTTALTFGQQVERKQTANVAGLLRGSDPKLAQEVVIYTAHHDHLGIGEPDATGDRIYNGAIDNGSGMAEILGVAKAFKALPTPPRRSVLALFVAGEEQGTLGSEYYAAHPTFPPGRIAANLNLDEGNTWGPAADVVFVGKGKSTLDEVIERYATLQDRVVKPDQFPERGYFYRSDQINFAKLGVPAYYQHFSVDHRGKPPGWGRQQVDDFEEHRYHQPSDEFDLTWNLDGMLEDVQLAFYAGLDVANADQMPAWKPGDEFEAARHAALLQLGDASSAPH